jgi:hypothetical protein
LIIEPNEGKNFVNDPENTNQPKGAHHHINGVEHALGAGQPTKIQTLFAKTIDVCPIEGY